MKCVCNSCGVWVDEDELELSREDMDGEGHYMTFYVCPNCGSDDISDLEKCELCEEYTEETTMVGTIHICNSCRKVLTEDVLYILAKIQGDLNTDEKQARELLEYYFE